MISVPKGMATALLLVTSVMFALTLASGSIFFEIYAVAAMVLAGQIYANATRSR